MFFESQAHLNLIKKYFYLFFCGMCMGAADLVPGISGGSIAFIMGFYNQLLENIKTFNLTSFKLLFSAQWRQFFEVVAWKFLSVLLLGIFVSFVTLTQVIHAILEHPVYRTYLYASFLGFVLASFFFCMRQIKHWKGIHVMGLLIGILTAYVLTVIPNSNLEGQYAIRIQLTEINQPLTNYNHQLQLLTHLTQADLEAMLAKGILSLNTIFYNNEGIKLGYIKEIVSSSSYPRLDVWLIFCGAAAICALLLPGISGSYLLTLLGVYPLVMGALADFIHQAKQASFDSESFDILFSLALGIIIGLLLFARVVSWLLQTYPNFTMALLSGFMLGALRSIWPFWTYEYALQPLKPYRGAHLILVDPIWPSIDTPFFVYTILFTLISFGSVYLIEYFTQFEDKKVNA